MQTSPTHTAGPKGLRTLLFVLLAACLVATFLWQDRLVALVQSLFSPYPQTPLSEELQDYVWNEEDAPNYLRESSPARIDWSLDENTVEYAPLDDLGRATGVKASLTHQTVLAVQDARESEERDTDTLERLDVRPSGWGSNERVTIVCPDGHDYHGWFWNRSHLLADSLGGEPRVENLITGTRMQNVGSNTDEYPGGMAWCESIARSWLWSHTQGDLLFSATPVYAGDDAVPLAVLVDMRSSDGQVDLHVIVYNAAKGYRVDYATGEFFPT